MILPLRIIEVKNKSLLSQLVISSQKKASNPFISFRRNTITLMILLASY